jgi:hypothetical protein
MSAPLNIRPFTDRLRHQYGRTSFIQMFDTVAGGGSRHVRLGLLFDSDGECDSRRTQSVTGDRWVQVDLEEDGSHSAWHFVVTADCPCGDQGPWRMRACTLPTPFTSPSDMIDAIRHELTRTDHPAPQMGATA